MSNLETQLLTDIYNSIASDDVEYVKYLLETNYVEAIGHIRFD